MKLLVSPTSPYARKTRVLARELDLMKMVQEVMTDPWTDAKLRAVNPLGKIPALILPDGSALFDSRVICEYLDELANGHFFPRPMLLKAAQGKWKALTLQALGDGLADAIVRRFVERKRPSSPEGDAVIARQDEAIDAGLAMAERVAAKFAPAPTIGEVTIGCALGYLDLRSPDQDWRGAHPALAAWYEKFRHYPSMKATEPPIAKSAP
jgi:glutathione S-transferase